MLPNTTSTPTKKDPEGPLNSPCERRKHTVDFPLPLVCLSRLRKQWSQWLLLSTSWTKGRGANESGSLSNSCIWPQVQRRRPSSKEEFFECVLCTLETGDEGSWGLWAPGVGVALVSFQPGCQVGQRNVAVGIRPTMEMLGAVISNHPEKSALSITAPDYPLWGPDRELWRYPIEALAVPTDDHLRTSSKVTESQAWKAPRGHLILPGMLLCPKKSLGSHFWKKHF